ncbi:MOSC domain-containing protein [Leptothrix sp. BB-4]
MNTHEINDDHDDDGSSAARIASLHVHPLKSGAALAFDAVRLSTTGFEHDRRWMLVDPSGDFHSQRTHPQMALLRAVVADGRLQVSAPGRPTLSVPVEPAGDTAVPVQVWGDRFDARSVDMAADPVAERWFSDFLGEPARLVVTDPAMHRPSNRARTGEIEALNGFADGYPILVLSTGSLAELNRRLADQGKPAVEMARFRPNLVLDGLDAHAEDHLHELHITTDDGPVVLRLVKPCPRCPMPDVDPATGVRGSEPGLTLAGYRADARLDGAITFGMNAVIVEGIGRTLRVGQPVRGTVRF